MPTSLRPTISRVLSPSSLTLGVAALQQTMAMFAGLVMVPLIIARGIGVSAEDSTRLVGIAILVSGLTTFLQVSRWGVLGSGYLLVMGSSSLFIAPSIMAGKAGGLALVCGMTLAMAPVEALLSPAARVLKRLAPPLVIGVIVILLACSIVPVSIQQFMGGFNAGDDLASWRMLAVGSFTVVCTFLANACPWGIVRVGSVIVGLLAGSALAALFGMGDVSHLREAAWLALPQPGWTGLAFSLDFALPFAMLYVISAIETFGDIHAIAVVSGEKMSAVENRRLSGGLMADAVGSALAGLFGTVANTSFSGNIAIAELSGVTSRKVGVIVAALLIVLSFFPKLAAALTIMPAPVLGGSMLVAVAILLSVGLRILFSGQPSHGELMVAGMALAIGLGVQSSPAIATHAPAWLAPLLRSSICMGTLVAIVGNTCRRWSKA